MAGLTPEEHGTVRPAPAWVYVVAAAFGALAALIVKAAAEALIGTAPVPLFTVVPLAIVAAVTWGCRVVARRRIQVRREPVPPRLAVTWLALAKTAALGGAAFTGAFTAYALASLSRLATSQGAARVLHASLAVVGGILLLIAGLGLERACRVPPDAAATNFPE